MFGGPLLIANRGEVAVRIATTAHRLGVPTVAVFSDADADSLHVDSADVAVRIGAAAAGESYLRVEALLNAAESTGARAVHPGYGFLSESAAFAQSVIDAGLTWVGPSPTAIELMGDKARSKQLAKEAGVPVIAGIEGKDPSPAKALSFGRDQGFPIVVKAIAGGGGKGMRVVASEEELAGAMDAARREAEASFGDSRVLVERFIERPRHIEIQVLADRGGQYVHLGERECSLQRRHQKVIEEAPSPVVDPKMREAMGAAAVELCRACSYEGVGTVEFIVPEDLSGFFFLEMNTRLQVEHPVTEAVYGIDLVEQQLRVAAGESLELRQEDLNPRGWAIEARVYAEDPREGFLPSTGRLIRWREPAGEGLRVDSGIKPGMEVSGHYDPMLAKVIGHGPDRSTALIRLNRGLADLQALGVETNCAFTRALLSSDAVASGELDTGLLERELKALIPQLPEDLLPAAALGAWLADTDEHSSPPGPWRRRFRDHGEVQIRDGLVTLGDRTWSAQAAWMANGDLRVELDRISRRYAFAQEGDTAWVGRDGHQLEARAERYRQSDHLADRGALEAPMPGTVLLVNVAPGDTVAEGDVLLVLESMKMELPIAAPHQGVVGELNLDVGDRVKRGELLATLGPPKSE